MKKLSFWLVMILVLTSMVTLAACGSGSAVNTTAIQGKWSFQTSDNGPTEGTIMEFKADKTVSIDLQDGTDPMVYNYTFYDPDELIICSTTPCDIENYNNWIGFMHFTITGSTMNAIISDMPLVLDQVP
jgi:hypothetical protein